MNVLHRVWVQDCLLLLVAAGILLYAIRLNQLRPHRIIVRSGVSVISDITTTDRFQVTIEAVSDPMGKTVLVYHTNELWSVWPIFR